LNVPSPERNQIVSLSKKLHSYEHKFNTMAQNYETEISHLQNLIKELKSEVQKRNKEIIDLNGKEKNLLTHIEEVKIFSMVYFLNSKYPCILKEYFVFRSYAFHEPL